MNIGFGSLSTAPRQIYAQRQKANQPTFSQRSDFDDDQDNQVEYYHYHITSDDLGAGRTKDISKDDITNLKIKLALSESSDDFIRSLSNTSEKEM